MLQTHVFLIIAWSIFSILHSLFAAESWKRKMQNLLSKKYKFYRSLYSLFAVISLGFVLFYTFSIRSILLWQVYEIEKIIALITMLSSLFVMLIFTKRFFFDLSGADVFKNKQTSRQLIETSLYKYVRHPLYSSTIIFIWSIFLWKPLLSNLITCISITIYTLIGILLEEKKLIDEFGESYIIYQSTTPMLVPRFLNKSVN